MPALSETAAGPEGDGPDVGANAQLPEGSWASTPASRMVMRGNRSRDTSPELAVRRELHGRGLRYFTQRWIRLADVRTRPDVVFPRRRIAVYVDGCFWHRCPEHSTMPTRNADYWAPKLQANVERDRRATAALAAAGWTVLRFWEHERPQEVADHVERVVKAPPWSPSRR